MYVPLSVQAVRKISASPFRQVLNDLRILANKEQLTLAFVGELAANKYGDLREATCVEILVGRDDLERLLAVAPHHCLAILHRSASGWHRLEHRATSIEIHVLPEGGKICKESRTEIPDPTTAGVNRSGFASLSIWIELMLSSRMMRDDARVCEVLKRQPEKQFEIVREHLEFVDQELRQRFEEILSVALHEREEDKRRKRR